ncbi:utrophin-like isoform X8 [Daphnia pulicaria]|nr:utrophin-like isoform X8 [Daphnia pulicaria]XP_046644688.1 utrophin-like isoform X8 [Daphnia pulicaria]
MRVHHLNNVSSAFRLLDKHNVKLVNISSNDIVDGNPKLTLGLVWSIILHYQVQDVLKGSMAELQQSSLDKTLLSWCQEATKDYAEIAITNFTTSWSDGLAFIALIHRFRPDLFDYELVSRKPANARLEYAFRMANKHLEIARLLDPEDVNTSNPDKKSIMMYVMCLYQALPHAKVPLVPANGNSPAETTTESSSASASRKSSSNEPVDFTAYQTLMEEVLVWLLAAEDHLDSATTVCGDLQSVKEQFHKHEEFLLELTSQQGSVGAVLHEGARLVKEGELSNEEADEIHIQMRLLNSRWDQLRTKSMDRQARIHETLTKLQQDQLERLRQWLTATEDRISQLAAVSQPESLTAAAEMLEDHQSLQRDLEAQQEHVNALSNMVVIVDESASDNCAQMEDQLSALGERWSHVCRWAEQRASALHHLSNHWEQLDADLMRLKSWLAAHEHSLRLIETNPSTDRSQMIDVARQLQLLERDMEPHVQRLSQLQDNIQRLPSLIHAVTVKENSKKIQPVGNYKCVDRLSSDVENFEDRIEALNEIMEAQRQRLAKSGVELTMIVLPPDITTSLTVFGSNDGINNSFRCEEEATSIKKRKLDSDRRFQFEETIKTAKEHLEQMEVLLEGDSNSEDLEKRHVENKPLLDHVLKSGHVLLDELQNEASESFSVEDTMSSITERWLFVEELLTQKSANQQETDWLVKAKNCEKEINETLSVVNKLNCVEERNVETLSKLQAKLQMATDQINKLASGDVENGENLETTVKSLKYKVNQLESRVSEFEKDVVLYKQLKDESQSLDNWMAEVQNFLTAEDVGWGDVEVLEAQLEQSNALQDDVKILEPSVVNVKHVISLLAPKVDEELSAEMNKISERLATTWITVIAGALQKNGVLATALSLTRQTVEGIESTNVWLNELELEIPPPAVINSTSELSQTLRKLNALKNRVDLKTSEYKCFSEAGNAVVANPLVSNVELKDNLRQLSQRWNDVSGGVLDRQRALKAASHHYGEFKVLTAQECDWQDKLEKKLMRSTTLAADAEEISEELDDLENYMKNRPKARILRIESMGSELVSLNIMTDSVGSEVKSLTDRWVTLEEKAKAKAEWLEKRVRGAQQCEQRLVQLHSAISSIDAELCSSLEQDLYGDELPELSQRLSQDIAQQEALLSEIRHEEEDYEAEGRKEAANRLHEQLSFIEATLQDVRNKFRKFQNPSELEPRLERMLRVLRDLEQSMCYIELASDDCEAIEGQLNNCIRFYASLSDIKTEVEAVLREGRQQVEDELVEDKLTVSAELDAMKALYNRLGEQVAVARETLERALQLSYQLNLDLNSMADWLNNLVTDIHKTEDTFVDNPNPVEEIRFYEKCLDDMVSSQPKMDSIRDNYGAFCGLCEPSLLEMLRERVEDITQEWQRIEERLKNKIVSLKGEGDPDVFEEAEEPTSPHLPQQNRNGDVPIRMYRSVVLTSVRQFTDPGSPPIQKACLELPASPTLTEDMDPKDLTIDGESEEPNAFKDDEMDGPGRSDSADTLGYFNAAFEDFDEQEKEAYAHERTSRSGLEVIRGNVEDFNEEDEEMMIDSTSSSDRSSQSSESGSVKNFENPNTENHQIQILKLDESYVVEVQAGNLPSPELPSMEVLNSRPITPDDFLTPEEEAWTYPTITVDEEHRSVTTVVERVEEVTVQNQVTFEQLVIERFNFQKLPNTSQDPCDSPITTGTPPSTPAMVELNALYQAFSNASAKADDVDREEVPFVQEALPPDVVTVIEDDQIKMLHSAEVVKDADNVEEEVTVVRAVQAEVIDMDEVIKAVDSVVVKEIQPEILEDPIEVMVVEVDEDVPAHFDDQLQVLANSRSQITISPHDSSESSSSSSSDSEDEEEKDIPVVAEEEKDIPVVAEEEKDISVVAEEEEDQLKVLPAIIDVKMEEVSVAVNEEIKVLEDAVDVDDANQQEVTAVKDVQDEVMEDPIEMKVEEIENKVLAIDDEQTQATEESAEMETTEVGNKVPANEDVQPEIMEEYFEMKVDEIDNKVLYIEEEQPQVLEDVIAIDKGVQENVSVVEDVEPQIVEDPVEVMANPVEEIITSLEENQPHVLEELQGELQSESSFSNSSLKGDIEEETTIDQQLPAVEEIKLEVKIVEEIKVEEIKVKEIKVEEIKVEEIKVEETKVDQKKILLVEDPIEIDEMKENVSAEVDVIEELDPIQVENVKEEDATAVNDEQLEVTQEPHVDVVMSHTRSSSSSSSEKDLEEEKGQVVEVSEDIHLHVVPSIEVTAQDSQAPATEPLLEEPIAIDDLKEEGEEVIIVKDEQLHVVEEIPNVDVALSKTVSCSTSSISSSKSDNVQEEIPIVENIAVLDNPIEVDEGPIKSDSTETISVLIDGEKEAIVLKCPLDQNRPLEADLDISNQTGSILLAANEVSGEDANDPTQRGLSVSNVRPPRKVSRDEGTQTDFCGYTGRLHVSTPVQPAELTSIIQPQTIPLQVEEMQATTTADTEVEPPAAVTTLQEIDADLNRLVASMEAAEEISTLSDGEVFAAGVIVAESKANEDVDSFYGSDKEIDSEVVFSHTDSSSSSSSSSESDIEPDQTEQQKKGESPVIVVQESPLEKEIAEFNAEVKLMSRRIDEVSAKFSPSSPNDLESAEMELSLLDPDVATLISRGDSLVLQVQKVDLERALRINTTTGELRVARTALKASSEVRRQRQVEQELTLKDCQKKTEQLQLWLANIAQTLDHVTRINDQSQIESLEEELNRRQSDIRQLTEAAGKLKEQQVLEYQALISSLTIRWQDLQRQFVDFQTKESSALAADLSDDMGGPDFVTRVNKLREAIASVSRQMHSPPLNLKHYEQLSGQEDSIKVVKTALYTLKGDVDTYNREKDDAVEAAEAQQQKEQIQRVLDKLREEWTLLNRTFVEKQARVHQSQTTWRTLHADMKDFEDWLTAAESSLVNLQSEIHNRAERKEKLKELESQVTARHKVMSNITSTCREVAAECSTADAVLLREKQDMLGKRWRSLLSGLAAVRQRLTSLDGSPLPVAKLTPLVMSPPKKDESNGSESDLTVHSAKETPPTTPSTIVASLDKSILQIRDWLTVLETMLKQQVAIVGDSDDVLMLLEKQKNVLRELEQKKPQLDELVQTAESIKDGAPPTGGKQLPAQDMTSLPPLLYHLRTCLRVSKLREHWEETASAVTARRNQLEELLTDSHQFERRKQDVDQWLGRMENRLSKLAPVAGTADLIDTQHREQKVLHNEIQQYKCQVEQLTQLSDKLVSSYPHDDTSRAVRTNDNLNQRYSVLHTGVNARGRALNAAMSSLHSFDRSLDKFMAWLSDTESALESLELELDSYGPGVKTSRERALMQLKELSVELDGRRDEQAGLAGAGQRLINTLSDEDYRSNGQKHQQSSHDDALMLRQRLDDMNRRWHGLRAKTVAIRNRLENNTEHWNALLLSLRELIEWVIRKDTELTGLGPIRGDLSTLVKQQDDFRAFRRQLDDKRPLIEQSILTGRQLVANEAPLSDASDSEAANRDLLPGDSRGYRSAEEAARELTQGIRREVTKLAERWAALRDRTERWNVDLDTTTNRVQQLQASMDDASNRLVPAETTRSKWINPTELSPQQVQQHMDQLKELSDKIAPVQLTIEEVNDQAARLADSGVPLSHANLSRLEDLNSRWKVLQSSMDDRYQQLCGVTRDGALSGPLLHSFLASSVDRPWERSVTEADVPYYVNHQTETTHWDHPQLEELMNSLSEFNDVRFSAYRMALKLRRVQKFLCLDKLELNTAIDTFDAHGLRAQNDKVIDIPDMVTVLRSLYEVVVTAYPGEIRLPLVIDLCLNWILNVYDSQRSGEIRVLSFKVVITLMCRGHLEDKYRYLFRLIADPNRLVDAPKLGVLLHDCVQMPRELGEVAAFGGSNIEPSVKCCFDKAGKQRQSIEAVHFLAWMKREPQSVVWLPVLHRLAASESARHQSKCNVCKATPIIGLRYRCLKCLSFDMCQTCFFTGRVSKHHKLTHPMQEYCTTTTSGEDLKDFTRTLRNKFKSKRYFKKHPRLGYLPVQTALEGTATPSDAQSEISSQMQSSVAQDVLVHSAATSVIDGIHKDFTPESEDEHQLIAQYCRSLNGDALGMSMGVAPRSPVQLLAALDSNHKEEIETMIRELEEENATLQAEYERLRSQQSPSMSFSFSSSPDDATPIPHQGGASSSGNHTSEVERDMLAEARLLRQHKTRLEARMKILEEHNRQLETQLSRLRQLLDEPGGNGRENSSPAKTGTLQTRSVTAAHLATDTPVRTNGHDKNHSWAEHGVADRLETRPPPPPHGISTNPNTYNAQNVGNLLFMAGDLGKAVGSLVNVMTDANDQSPGLTDEED